ncbi:MAG: hypothetical protein GY722_18140 [bacterium]|nr:hypothetical protein [bacterium]
MDEPVSKFTGHERDPHGLSDYMLGRTYFYSRARFGSVDKARDGWNLYAYVRNSPVNYLDPDGNLAAPAFVSKVLTDNAESRQELRETLREVPLAGGVLATVTDSLLGSVAPANAEEANAVLVGMAIPVGGVGKAGGGKVAKEGSEHLVRFGKGAETASQLGADAARAEAAGFPHGVSTKLVRRLSGSDKAHRSALKSDVERRFVVEQTGRNPSHHTVHLPKPVTETIAEFFSSVFKRK